MKPWNSLSPTEKIDSLTKVLTRAGSDRRFRKDLLNPSFAKAAVQAEMGATFDESMSIRILPDQAAAEKEIVLLLPQLIEGAEIPHKADDYWLCTYSPYVDSAPFRGKNLSDESSVSPLQTRSIEAGKNAKRWNILSSGEKLDALTNVLTRAGSDRQFRKQCLNPVSAKVAVQREADVIFDDDIIVRILPNQVSAEKEIVLLLPDLIENGELPRKADDYWLCSYWPYVDESNRSRLGRSETTVR